MSLLTDLEKTHVRAWAEDDATLRDPDHESLRDAMDRLGLPWGKDGPTESVRHEGFVLLGDAEAWELDDGTVIVSSYPGASEIWTPKCTGRLPREETPREALTRTFPQRDSGLPSLRR